MKGKLILALAALAVTSVSYAQSSLIPPAWRAAASRMQPTPFSVTPETNAAQYSTQYAAPPASASTTGIPAQFAGHHHRSGGGCATCNQGAAFAPATNSGCSSCGGGNSGLGFVGDCCQNYVPWRSTGLWNSYCSGGHGHHGRGCGGGCGGGCGMGCGRGGCCTKVPIGMYGVTPYGCCLAGVGFGNCGCGGCGGGCGKHHGCRQSGWRWGAGGCGCDGSVGPTGCCTNGGSYDNGNGTYDNMPANGIPTDAAPAVPEEAPPVAPMDPPSVPTSQKSARTIFRPFPSY